MIEAGGHGFDLVVPSPKERAWLAAKYPRLDRASQKEREDLYEITQGNPLFIRWIAGQLGRAGSQCRTIADPQARLACFDQQVAV